MLTSIHWILVLTGLGTLAYIAARLIRWAWNKRRVFNATWYKRRISLEERVAKLEAQVFPVIHRVKATYSFDAASLRGAPKCIHPAGDKKAEALENLFPPAVAEDWPKNVPTEALRAPDDQQSS